MSGLETISISADAGAVEIDEATSSGLVVQRLAGVLLEMQPLDADGDGIAVGRQVDHDLALADDRLLYWLI
jgi:hypothetical protein